MYHNTLIIRSLEINFQFTYQGLSFEKNIKIRSMSQHKSKLTHLNIDERRDILIFLMNVLSYVYICLLRKKSAPLLIEGTIKYTHLAK